MKKRGRGRPRKIKSKIKVIKYKKRGRPRKIKKAIKKEVVIEIPIKKYKFLGYCKCGFMISKNDFESKFIFTCPSCGNRQRKKQLLQEMQKEKYTNKKDYLEHTINAQHIDMPANREDVPPEIFKTVEEDN